MRGQSVSRKEFQSTLPMRGATMHFTQAVPDEDISIHTPHAGSDLLEFGSCLVNFYFNPHSPCGERPLENLKTVGAEHTFQSTLPMRGATSGHGRAVMR